MAPKRRTKATEGASEPPELAPVEQSLRAKIQAMSLAELEALGVTVEIAIQARKLQKGQLELQYEPVKGGPDGE